MRLSGHLVRSVSGRLSYRLDPSAHHITDEEYKRPGIDKFAHLVGIAQKRLLRRRAITIERKLTPEEKLIRLKRKVHCFTTFIFF